jgi:subtilisin family serine protease
MRRFALRCGICFIGITLVVLALSSFTPAKASPTQVSDPPSDQVVVKPKHGVAISTILSRYDATQIGVVPETGLYFLKLNGGQTASQVLPAMNADPDLYYAEPDYYSEGGPDGTMIMFGAHMAPSAGMIMFGAHGDQTSTPNGGTDQWAWIKTRLAEAQKVSTGQGIIIAVLDTGMAPDHPLLRSSITAGYDFVGMSDSIYDTGNGIDDDGNGVLDNHAGHGTHVSGIIVTAAPGVQIMPIRVLNSDGVGTYWEVAAGIRYAVDHGAKIINMSLSAPRLTPSLDDALKYAASHGVIVVAAAGVGSGPNYPAAYSDRLTVVGVGATDQTDKPAWFSGGQLADTDVFAPGVEIYSAFPYGAWGMGSGTSMAAPVVSAEAGLLMSRYPDWSRTQVIQRILDKVAPVSGYTVGRVDLAAAVTTSVKIDYMPGDPGSPNDNGLVPRIKVVNNTPETIPLRELTIRYWYTADSNQSQNLSCDYTSLPNGCGNITSLFTRLVDGSPNKTSTSDTYLEIGFRNNPASLAPAGWFDMAIRVNKSDWSNYNETNDYSYDPNRSAPTQWNRITIYRNGVLVWGIEPTNAAQPAPATLSPTNTPLPTVTLNPTMTPTKTSSPAPSPTVMPTSLAATTTSQPGFSLKAQYLNAATAANSGAISPHLNLFNTGTTSIVLKDVTLRYWFTADGAVTNNYWCDYASLGCTRITYRFVTLAASRTGADTFLEIGFTSDAGSLAAGTNTGTIQNRFSKSDWGLYTQTGDYSFDPSKTQFADWSKVTVYLNGTLVWGVEP